MKLYNFRGEEVYIEKEEYECNGRIAVCMYTKNGEPYCDVTTNLPEEKCLSEMSNYVNEEGDGMDKLEMIHWLEDNGIAMQTYASANSGYNTYWEMIFNVDKF